MTAKAEAQPKSAESLQREKLGKKCQTFYDGWITALKAHPPANEAVWNNLLRGVPKGTGIDLRPRQIEFPMGAITHTFNFSGGHPEDYSRIEVTERRNDAIIRKAKVHIALKEYKPVDGWVEYEDADGIYCDRAEAMAGKAITGVSRFLREFENPPSS